MFTRNRHSRLGLEQLEDRCTPSAVLGDPRVHVPVRHDAPAAIAPAHVSSTGVQALLVRMDYRCFADVRTMEATASGFATRLGHWTSQGRLDSSQIDAGRATIRGTTTIVTANGDKLFVKFTSSWELSTGKGHKVITVTGGTGQFAGASGFAFMACKVTADPASPFRFSCDCKGTGILILPRR